ncbi:hypothetical protein OCC_13780 [Thermococcus litoralis DSM 5473]|jgi:hypothetical protein|uniref:Uncharacterized protein n=1 Tax=Thermococcus litoralis (strain ATCC 51850 / DSM 5473 / JCM 8560 / NS-C) TaxID=523849 RepID=S5ZB00_THELN|nr:MULTISPECIES: hypothetical protein [Thermococcus]AGT34243.1 hypothetical protein OCC_13780 [Thermococcus litoralis DSM 5473]KUK00120.1 MAG: hypothetical protein XD43_0208 [Thermococcales archaeon 44_46]MDK2982718.1 hypothetical protein [Thermococcaceae archaeon]MDN5319739.1 hypothetical protein [Thermococcaceae archaeon]
MLKVVETTYERASKFIGITACSGRAIWCGGDGSVVLLKPY